MRMHNCNKRENRSSYLDRGKSIACPPRLFSLSLSTMRTKRQRKSTLWPNKDKLRIFRVTLRRNSANEEDEINFLSYLRANFLGHWKIFGDRVAAEASWLLYFPVDRSNADWCRERRISTDYIGILLMLTIHKSTLHLDVTANFVRAREVTASDPRVTGNFFIFQKEG